MREAATFTVGRSGDRRAVSPLLKALGDRRPSVQALACLGLGQIDDGRVAPALIATLADARKDDATRAACAYAIGARKISSASPALLSALGDNRGEAQRLAAWALGQLGDAKSLGPLIRAYFSRGGRSDAELVWAIGRTSGAGLAPAQVGGFSEYPQRNDKYNAPEAIAVLPGTLPKAPAAGKLVVDHADDISKGLLDALAEHRDVVVAVLADLDGTPTQLGLGALSPATADTKTSAALATIAASIAPAITALATSEDPKVRALVVSVLAKLDGGKLKVADAAIAKGLADPADQVRAAAMNAIPVVAHRRGTAPAEMVAALTRTLAGGAWADRRAAALAMGKLGAGADTPALIKSASDSSSFVREAVAIALTGISGTSVVEPLLTLSRDEVAQVRAAAARGLGTLKDERATKRRNELVSDPDPAVRAAVGS